MQPRSHNQAVHRAANLIRRATSGVVLTGAGISTPSGIPDFRSPGSGLWAQYNPMEVASLSAFRYSPEKFYNWIRPFTRLILNAVPNAAHEALVQLESAGFIHSIITQNIDGLHQRAGSSLVIEVHGTIDSLTCIRCFHSIHTYQVIDRYLKANEIPRCPNCDGYLKPDVILFEEQLPFKIWQKAEKAVQTCDLMVVAGSSLEVLPVARLPLQAAERGASLIVINHQETYINERAEVVLTGDVADILPAIVEEVLIG